jgi:hypothetical protein
MDATLSLNRLAVHYVNKNSNIIELAKKEQNVKDLNPIVVDFLMKIVSDIWDAEDAANVNSGRFSRSTSSSLTAKKQINRILTEENSFFDASIKLAQHLYGQSPGNASTGLLGVLKLLGSDNAKKFVAILKIQLKDEKLVKLSRSALTQITVEDVQNLLLEKIQKGAICPHPKRTAYDLKVIDKQVDDPAIYFRERFLGCTTKKSDEHQVKRLIPTIERYARQRKLPFPNERVPEFINALKSQRRDIITPLVARVIRERELLGPDFQNDDFVDYIRESDLGEIDIPREQFERRPTKTYKPRRLIITMKDPKYEGVIITSPIELVDDIMSIEGDSVTFTFRTTTDGFKSNYK